MLVDNKGVVVDAGEMIMLKEGFEGPEKNLQVVFEPALDDVEKDGEEEGGEEKKTPEGSLRSITQDRWSAMLELARCKILSCQRGAVCDAYVLSESSLFVFDRRVILKTCGTTRLLHALDDIVSIGASLALSLRAVFYSRKNFTFSHLQPAPHDSFASEVAFLEDRFSGNSAVVGPTAGDHWCFYLADLGGEGAPQLPIELFELKMHELHPDSSALFYERPELPTEPSAAARAVTKLAGIDTLVPEQRIDEHLFSPCGYSMNGLDDRHYSTIHITPEEHCSYASFETDVPISAAPSLLHAVTAIFRPATFSATLVLPVPGFDASSLPNPPAFIPPSGYSAFGRPVMAMLGNSLLIVTWSFVYSDPLQHPLALLSARRLVASSSSSPSTPPSPLHSYYTGNSDPPCILVVDGSSS